MLTFQSIIDEARKQKEIIVEGLYEKMKEHPLCYNILIIKNRK